LANPGDVTDKVQTLRPRLGPGCKIPWDGHVESETDHAPDSA